MKKTFMVALLALFTISASAQLITSNRVSRGARAHNIWVDLGGGFYTGDTEDTGLGIDLGIRYNKMFTENIGWDILKVSAQTDTKNFSDALDVQVKTGVRGVSPVVFGNSTIYANVAAGVGFYTKDFDDRADNLGFAWEVGAGVNITPRFAVGIVYNSHNLKFKYEDYDVNGNYYTVKSTNKVGLLSLRLSYAL